MADRCGSKGGRPTGSDSEIYKGRDEVEHTINRLKNSRVVATRYGKRAYAFHGIPLSPQAGSGSAREVRPAPRRAQNSSATSSVAHYSADGMTTLASFTFVRHIDGLRYHFERYGEHNDRPAYRRTDGNVWCVWSPTDGWHCEIADGLVTARPLNGHADEPEPPATVWRSFKNDRSYLYDLRALDPEA